MGGVVKAFPGGQDPQAWGPPRGVRDGRGWGSDLRGRELERSLDGPLEIAAVTAYRELIATLSDELTARGWSQRVLAHRAALSQSATSKALSGTSWPRWATLLAMVAALDLSLTIDGMSADPIVELLAALDREPEYTGRLVAGEVGVRPNTIYDLRKGGRTPSTATVFAIAAWCELTIGATRSR